LIPFDFESFDGRQKNDENIRPVMTWSNTLSVLNIEKGEWREGESGENGENGKMAIGKGKLIGD
jgi:hypothetical protein